MSTTGIGICDKCGAKLLEQERVCSACMLETALLPLLEDEVDAVSGGLTSPPSPMTEFGDYDLIEEIGRGSQGVVYRARQRSLNRTVALKVIALGHWASTPHLKRFRHEAEAAASLEHPQIVPIYEIGERDGSCYFSMKFVEGGRLDKVVRQKTMPTRRAAELLVKIARTVQFAHEHGILHRDIKPGNILLDRDGEPHLTDFGLARLIEQESTITNSFEVLGTPSFMAPEQAAGRVKELTAAADVYALGAVFYQMLTGEPPFAGGTTYETIRLVLETEPRNPRARNSNIDVDLATVCLKCLEKEPGKRYQTAAALAEDLERWLRHEPIRARPGGFITRSRKWVRRNPLAAAVTPLVAALTALVAVLLLKNGGESALPASIAVLPFENLSDATETTLFADGIQDDILTKLAKIADLKVISRTSVMQYRGPHDIKRIAQALKVSHVLEGSVRRSPSRIHLNTQLIDIRTDTHLWAEEYDRDLIDMFAIQSQVAQKVAEQLHAKISSGEKASIERPPTADLTAFELYSRAKNLFLAALFSNSGNENLLQAANLLNQAVERDPSFFQAYCQLVWIHDLLYLVGHNHTPARLALAEAALQSAFRLQPDAGEAHLARAEHLYRGSMEYESALAELEVARQSLPNDPRVFELQGYIKRRQGKHEEALHSLERATDIDPQNVPTLQQIANSCILLQRYGDAKSALKRAEAIKPNDIETKVAVAWVDLEWKGDTQPLHHEIDSIRASTPADIPHVADGWLICALAERDAASAKQALLAADQNTALNDQAVHFGRSFVEGLLARMSNDPDTARSAFLNARAEQEQIVKAEPNYAPPLCVLGLIDAALGRKEEALAEGRRAIELVPTEKDALNGPLMVKYSAMIAAWVGENNLACEQLAGALRYRTSISYGYLKLLPFWDPLRGDPRFQKILASLAPK